MDDPALDTLPLDELHPDGRHNCAEWRAEDKAKLHPIQFYPRYLHCLIDYGRQRWRGPTGPAGAWDRQPGAEPPPPVAVPQPTP